MGENLIVLAVPIFLVLTSVEGGIVYWKKLDYYRLGDTISSISCGVLEQLLHALVGIGPAVAMYYFVAGFAPVQWPAGSWLTWAFTMLMVDFIYYWWHRMSHRINVLWAGHVVHHQSEEFNFSTALRQSWITSVTISLFMLPIALMGIPFEVYFACLGINVVYQFWVHTRLIDKLGPVEWVFNTPSHHRVHHGVNPEYIDRNYAGILIVWDRMFGTFEPERAPVHYGLVHPLRTWNPLVNNFEYWGELLRRSMNDKGVWGRLRHWVKPPEWTPTDPNPPLVLEEYRPRGYRKFEPQVTRQQRLVGAAAFALLLVSSAAFLRVQEHLSQGAKILIALSLMASTVLIARLIERQRMSGRLASS